MVYKKRVLLENKIAAVSFSSIKEDIRRFIKDDDILEIWSPEYFTQLVDKMKFDNA